MLRLLEENNSDDAGVLRLFPDQTERRLILEAIVEAQAVHSIRLRSLIVKLLNRFAALIGRLYFDDLIIPGPLPLPGACSRS